MLLLLLMSVAAAIACSLSRPVTTSTLIRQQHQLCTLSTSHVTGDDKPQTSQLDGQARIAAASRGLP